MAHQAQSLLSDEALKHQNCNIPPSIRSKVGENLHLRDKHPLNTIKKSIEDYFQGNDPSLQTFDNLCPVVPIKNNFDLLRIPPDHVSRSKSDTYYLNDEQVLRTHTSAHQVDLLTKGINSFLVSGDAYRRDEIDSSHYPVFHQMEGVKLFSVQQDLVEKENLKTKADQMKYVELHLKQSLEGLVRHLFGDVEIKWGEDYFPFTHPSFELEILYDEKWLEVLGSGVIHPQILTNSNLNKDQHMGWAFGLGLERLAMILFKIPDIRLFWTEDPRFHSQFTSGSMDVTFQPYSKYPPCLKDMSFWILSERKNEEQKEFHVNDLMEIVRDVAGDIVEKVWLVDEFVHPKTSLSSHCYRISYRSMDRSLTNEEIDELQFKVRERTEKELAVELR